MERPNRKGWVFTNSSAIYTHYSSPIYGSVYGISKDCVDYAIKNNLILIIKTPHGTATYKNPKDFLKNTKIIKKIHFYPNNPLLLYQKDILPDIKKREERKKIEKKMEDSKGNLMIEYLKKLKEKKPEDYNKLKDQLSLILNTS